MRMNGRKNYRKRISQPISMLLAVAVFLSSESIVLAGKAEGNSWKEEDAQERTISGNIPGAVANTREGGATALDEYGLEITYTGSALKAVNPQAVYTSKTKSNLDTSGDGSKENPYNRFEDAVSNVSDGGTIYIVSSHGAFLNTQDEYGNLPFVIDKSVTIEPEPGAASADMSCRAAGIILGGDVTFKNINLEFANKYHDVIAANGYRLVLDNVSHSGSSRLVDLVAGSLYDKNSGKRLGAAPGNNGSIRVCGGSWFGNLYAGSLNGSYDGNAEIVIEGSRNMEIGDIYACGADEPEFDRNNWFDFTELPPPTANPVKYPVNGSVRISLKKAPVRNVDGAGARDGSLVVFETEYPKILALTHVTEVIVRAGGLEPKLLTPQEGKRLKLSVERAGTLDLTQVKNLTVDSFAGGGKLVLDRNSTLTVVGELIGDTIFETSGGYNGCSGIAVDGQVYIRAGAGTTGTFHFTPNYGQPTYKLKKQADGAWKMVSGSSGSGKPPLLTDIRIENVNYPNYFTYTARSVESPDPADFETNSRGTYAFAWYEGKNTAGIPLQGPPVSVGYYTLKVEVKDGGKVEASLELPVTIGYLETTDTASVGGTMGNNNWYVGEVSLHAPAGYSISNKNTGTEGWGKELVIKEDMDAAYTYYLKEDKTGGITDERSAIIRKDTESPTMEVVDGEGRNFQADWYAVPQKIKVSAEDKTSGIKSVAYCMDGSGYHTLLEAGDGSEGRKVWDNSAFLLDALEGDHTYTITAEDYAGNKTSQSVRVKQGSALTMENIFTDVKRGDWFYDAVNYVYINNIMRGTGNGRFAPSGNTNRAMVVQILYNVSGDTSKYEGSAFSDVAPGQWYANAVQWAVWNKVTSGVSAARFAPEQDVTRQEVACFLFAYAKWKGYDVSGRNDLSQFHDKAQVSGWALEAMMWANHAGIINGKSSARLDPLGKATRAEIAVMMNGFIKKYQ